MDDSDQLWLIQTGRVGQSQLESPESANFSQSQPKLSRISQIKLDSQSQPESVRVSQSKPESSIVRLSKPEPDSVVHSQLE